MTVITKTLKTAKKTIPENFLEVLIKELEIQSENHPDLSLRGFYKAYLEKLKAKNNISDLIRRIKKIRPDENEKHMSYLVYRGLQYILLYEKSRRDFSAFSREDWLLELESLLNNPKDWSIYVKILENESVQTTIYQRYVGPKAAISTLFGRKPVAVLDVGCGLNLGLPGIENQYPFREIIDETHNHVLTGLVKEPVLIKKGYGLDLRDPVEKKFWALACGFYPGEISQLPEVEQMCDLLWRKTKVKFIRGDVKKLGHVFEDGKMSKVDVVIASTIFYQLKEEERKTALGQIRAVLRKGGYLIINDFLAVNEELHFDVDWFNKGQSVYRTVVLKLEDSKFSRPLEFIRWDTGRCRKASEGRDFAKVIKLGGRKY